MKKKFQFTSERKRSATIPEKASAMAVGIEKFSLLFAHLTKTPTEYNKSAAEDIASASMLCARHCLRNGLKDGTPLS